MSLANPMQMYCRSSLILSQQGHSSEILNSIEKNGGKVWMVFFINIGPSQHVGRGILTFQRLIQKLWVIKQKYDR